LTKNDLGLPHINDATEEHKTTGSAGRRIDETPEERTPECLIKNGELELEK
jgi:hypothetical protein